jgi:hypothetical protein
MTTFLLGVAFACLREIRRLIAGNIKLECYSMIALKSLDN